MGQEPEHANFLLAERRELRVDGRVSQRRPPAANGSIQQSAVFQKVAQKIESLHGLLTSQEAEILFRMASEVESGCIVEVGSHVGEGTLALCAGASIGAKIPVYAIDTHAASAVSCGRLGFECRSEFFKLFSRTDLIRYVHLINAPSAIVSVGWREQVSMLVFSCQIDNTIAADFAAWRPHLRAGALVVVPESALGGLNKLIETRTLSFVEQQHTLVLFRYTARHVSSAPYARHTAFAPASAELQKAKEFSEKPESISYQVYFGGRGQYLYQPIPKNACTTIKTLLLQMEGLPVDEHEWRRHQKEYNKFPGVNHLTRQEQIDVFEGRTETFKFVIVRNPFARLASAYCDKVMVHPTPHILTQLREAAAEQGVALADPISFAQFVSIISRQRLAEMDQHWLPQYYLGHFASIKFDFVGKMESMPNDLIYVLERCGAPERVLAQVNERRNVAKSSLNLWDSVPSEVRQQFFRAFEIDFDTLKYHRRLL
jgi:hypothetical protein